MQLATIPAEGQAVLRIDLDRILDNPYQYRRSYDAADLAELAANIRAMAAQLPGTSGLQSPPLARLVTVERDGDLTPTINTSRYELMHPDVRCQLLFGHRRLRAFRLLAESSPDEYATLPITIVTATDEQMWQAAITENTQRSDVSPIDEALSLQKAMLEFGLTSEEAGQPFGWSRSTVANKIRLLDLPAAYLDAVAAGTISESAGRTLLMLAKAPHLLNEGTAYAVDKLADLSRRDLENLIKRTVATLQPIPPGAGFTGYKRPSWGDKDEVIKHPPPPFPLEWMPSPTDERVIGPCGGCAFLVQFAGDAGPRCAQNNAAVCYNRKTVLWAQHEFNRQRTVVATTPTQPAAAATPPPPTGLRPTPTPSAVASAPQMAVYDNKDDKTITWFGSDYHAPADLIKQKLCGEQQCECFVLAYRKEIDDYNRDKLVRPDPANAPNLCYGCTSGPRLANRRKQLEHGLDVADKRKAERQASADTEQRLRDALETYTPAELWGSTTFMRSLAETNIGWAARDWRLDKLQSELWIAAAATRCKKLSKYSVDLYLWQPDLAEAWLQSIRTNEEQS